MKFYKSISIGILIIMGVLGIFSCSSELDIKPTAELENEYFETEIRIQEGIGACYAAMANMYGPLLGDGGGIHEILLLPGDDITHQDAGRAATEAFSGLNSSNGQVNTLWTRLYQMIYRCNFILEKIEEEEVKKAYETAGLFEINQGEILFLRSWCFYRLWDFFRKAPLQDKRIRTISEAILPPSEGFQMLDKAIEDLELAATLLPEENYWPSSTERGRAFNESAYGLLVKCYTLRARYNNASPDDYQKAISAFEKINTRELVHFADNFDFQYENNAESLFEFQASHATEEDNAWLDNNFGGGAGQMGAMYHYNTSHWGNYMSGIYGPTQKLMNAFEEEDPRKEYTFANYTTNVYGDVTVPADPWNKFDNQQLMKYVTPGRCWFEKGWGISSTNNTRLIRYADIKLLAAEAYLQTGAQGEALREINDIRERARRSTTDGSTSTYPADLTSVSMQNIMDERFLELAAEEGIRWTDLRSWHAAGFIDLSTWTAKDFGYNYDEKNFELEIPKHLLFPIPQGEMNTNPLMAAAGNNPGYE
ncbi:Starch-binding associating with outer membrane [Mariniphaga anaerophila]|uniref:Starch-binding associating with outer membrane n=1 Tax=Mariniphaga anaerophila TaxID=1484053 RepID=A0A1M4YZQ9_9BACT|nr:RagB/SusD family nutrient uptake outer membrane protein [Mariniphaga anaerophila]SHF11195.1 Starch-binding associating with outer membrane [Mariniphaga anaerophila]